MKYFSAFFLFLCCFFVYSQEKKDSISNWNIKGEVTFLFNQSSFSNWTSGGEDAIASNININYDLNYKKGKINWDNKIITTYGLSYTSDDGYRKTNDNFEYNSLFGLKYSKYWFFSFLSNFKTQYARGYDYEKSPKETTSNFFSPAYLSLGPGMLWKKSDQLRVNLAPATTKTTIVSDEFSGNYGVEEGRNISYDIGFNLSAYYKVKLMKNVNMENIIALYSNYLINPQNIDLDYRMNLVFVINKYITSNITAHTIIDNNASSKVQFNQQFGLGINYLFHEK